MDFPYLIVPDYSEDILGQNFVNPQNSGWTFPGSSDTTGINGSSPSDGSNPNSTGGWQNVALQISRMALAAFTVYENGSTAAATPPRRVPGTVISAPGTTIGGISSSTLTTVLFVVAGGILLFVLVKKAT